MFEFAILSGIVNGEQCRRLDVFSGMLWPQLYLRDIVQILNVNLDGNGLVVEIKTKLGFAGGGRLYCRRFVPAEKIGGPCYNCGALARVTLLRRHLGREEQDRSNQNQTSRPQGHFDFDLCSCPHFNKREDSAVNASTALGYGNEGTAQHKWDDRGGADSI